MLLQLFVYQHGKQPRTQGFIFAPVALALRKNPGPGWSRDTFISCNPWGGPTVTAPNGNYFGHVLQ